MDAKKLIESLCVKKGDVITVAKWRRSKDRSWIGDPLKVVAVDLPNIVIAFMEGPLTNRRHSLNLDEVEIRPLSDEYVAALTGSE